MSPDLERLLDLLERGTLRLRDTAGATLDLVGLDTAELIQALKGRGVPVPLDTAPPPAGPPETLGVATQGLDARSLREAETLVVQLHVDRPTDTSTVQQAAFSSGPARYLIGQELARGGMGTIRLAQDRDLGRSVALKSLHPNLLADRTMTDRFVREAQLTGQLQHPGIVPVHDIGKLDQDAPFYTMQLIHGHDLGTIFFQLRNQDPEYTPRYSRIRLLNILQQVCRTVGFAHANGVVHRDLKPANIMVGEHGQVYVMDWGIAKVLDKRAKQLVPTPEGRARDKQLLGTPYYMSPEQARADMEAIGPPSDVFALGAILYEILTQEPPFEAVNLEGLLQKILYEDPVPFERRGVHLDVSPSLQTICMKALAKKPSDRYADANALAEDLQAEIEGDKQRARSIALAAQEWARAEQILRRHGELEDLRLQVVQELTRLRRSTPSWSPPTQREQLANKQSQLDLVDVALGKTFSEATARLNTVLRLDSLHSNARADLERLYRQKYRSIQQTQDYANILFYGTRMLKARTAMPGPEPPMQALLSIRTVPAGAEVFVMPYAELDQLTYPGPEHRLGASPIRERPFAPGGYLIVARYPGYEDRLQALFLEPSAHEHELVVLEPLVGQVPLVGRDEALRTLRETVQDTVVNERQNVIWLRGPRGAGSSRLIVDLTESLMASPDVFVFVRIACQCRFRHVPYSTVRLILQRRFGLAPQDDRTTVRDIIAQMQENLGRLARRQPWPEQERREAIEAGIRVAELPALVGGRVPAEVRRAELRDAFADVFAKMARTLPVVLVIEHAGCIDDASLDLLHAMLSATAQSRMFVALWTPARGSLAIARLQPLTSQSQVVALPPFARTDTRRCLEAILGGSCQPETIERIHTATGGLPRWVVETCRVWGRNGALQRREGLWQLDSQVDAGQLQPKILAQRHLSARSALETEVLRAAAVAGQPFMPAELTALGVRQATEGLRLLAADGIIVPSEGATGRFDFAYPELAAAARRLVPVVDRPRLHSRLAQWWMEAAPNDTEHEAVICMHLARAGRGRQAALWAESMAASCLRLDAPEESRWWQRRAEMLGR